MKLRHKTWYWGKFIDSGSWLGGSIITQKTEGFEPYFEHEHGFHLSEEYKDKDGQLTRACDQLNNVEQRLHVLKGTQTNIFNWEEIEAKIKLYENFVADSKQKVDRLRKELGELLKGHAND